MVVRGTRNALVSLGASLYIEILAPQRFRETHPRHRTAYFVDPAKQRAWGNMTYRQICCDAAERRPATASKSM